MNECSSKKVSKIITIGESPIVIPRDVTHLVFNGEKVPKWFLTDCRQIAYENLFAIIGYNLKELDLGLFPYGEFGELAPRVKYINIPLGNIENGYLYLPALKALKSLICEDINYYSKLPESIEELVCSNKSSWRFLNTHISSYDNLRILRLDGVTELPIGFRFPLGIEYLSLESLPKVDVSYLKNLKWCKFKQ